MEVPIVAFIIVIAVGNIDRSGVGYLVLMFVIVACIAVLMLSVLGANLFASERSNQTLDVLLTQEFWSLVYHKGQQVP